MAIRPICRRFTIYSTGRNENGRTPCILCIFSEGRWKTYPGERMDSPADYQSMREINKYMEKFRRENIRKQIESERRAAKVIINC